MDLFEHVDGAERTLAQNWPESEAGHTADLSSGDAAVNGRDHRPHLLAVTRDP